jgi:hypothetical protein
MGIVMRSRTALSWMPWAPRLAGAALPPHAAAAERSPSCDRLTHGDALGGDSWHGNPASRSASSLVFQEQGGQPGPERAEA